MKLVNLASFRPLRFRLLSTFAFAALSSPVAFGQGGMAAEQLASLKDTMAKNKAALAQYTWRETVTIYLKGEEKKQEHFQVKQGPDGKPVKTPLDPTSAANDSGKRGGRLKQRIVEKKKEEFEEYGERVKSLLSRYLPPDKDLIQDAYQKGNASFTPESGTSGIIKVVIKNYLKTGDSLTITLDKNQKALTGLSVASYLDDPQDSVTVNVQNAKLPDGTSYTSTVNVNLASKQMVITTKNSDYTKL